MQDIYEKNLDMLKKKHPALWAKIRGIQSEAVGELYSALNGQANLRMPMDGLSAASLHLEGDPSSEAIQFLDLIPPDSTSVVILIGMGLGYAPLAILKERPKIRHLAVFDLNPGIFKQALKAQDLRQMLADPRLLLGIDEAPDVAQVLAPATIAMQLEDIQSLTHNLSFTFNFSGYTALQKAIFEYTNRYNVEGATTFHFGRSYMENRFKQLTSINHDFLLENLRDCFSGIPAVMVAAGPSLNKNIHLLWEIQNKAVIFAADAAVPALLANNVTPHFITSIDPQTVTYEKFASAVPRIGKSSLICMPWVAPKVPKVLPCARVFWCFSAMAIEEWINSYLGGSLLTGGAGTVAHLNLTAAVILGCSPKIFIGQDLAFAASEGHSDHVFLTNESSLREQDTLQVPGAVTDTVTTNRGFLMLLRTFESMIASTPGHYINATEGGAHIEGTEVLSLARVIDEYCHSQHDIFGLIDKHADQSGPCDVLRLQQELRSLEEQIQQLRKDFSASSELIKVIQSELTDLKPRRQKRKQFADLPAKLQAKVIKVEAMNNKIDKATTIWGFLENLTREGLRQSERMKQEIDRLAGRSEHYIPWLHATFDRVAYVNKERLEGLDFLESHFLEILQHHAQEMLLQDRLAEEMSSENKLNLAKFYFSTGHIRLAKPLLEELENSTAESAEIFFELGCIALLHNDLERAESHFNMAQRTDVGTIQRIADFRHQLGDEAIAYARGYKERDQNTYRRLLFKAFRSCPTHELIVSEMQTLLATDVGGITQTALDENRASLIEWNKLIDHYAELVPHLIQSDLALLKKHCARIHVQDKNLPEALRDLAASLSYNGADPETHIALMDLLFSQGYFEQGIKHLNMAISLDIKKAAYWEVIGDKLLEDGNFSGALAAYQQCLAHLPNRPGVNGKIVLCRENIA